MWLHSAVKPDGCVCTETSRHTVVALCSAGWKSQTQPMCWSNISRKNLPWCKRALHPLTLTAPVMKHNVADETKRRSRVTVISQSQVGRARENWRRLTGDSQDSGVRWVQAASAVRYKLSGASSDSQPANKHNASAYSFLCLQSKSISLSLFPFFLYLRCISVHACVGICALV